MITELIRAKALAANKVDKDIEEFLSQRSVNKFEGLEKLLESTRA